MKKLNFIFLVSILLLASCYNARIERLGKIVQRNHDNVTGAIIDVDAKIKKNEIPRKLGVRLKDSLMVIEVLSQEYLNKFSKVKTAKSPLEKEQLLFSINKSLDRFINVSDDILNDYDDIKKLDILNDFSLDESFPSGDYEIKSDQIDIISRGYNELVNKIINKCNSKNSKPIVVHISIYGFSDGEEFTYNSSIRAKLIKDFNLPQNVQSNIINEKLSYKRAQEISKILQRKLKNNNNLLSKENVKFDIREIGKGEELPFKNINYTKDDNRRRIVRIQWCLIPQKYYN
jgi:hypothetical protein